LGVLPIPVISRPVPDCSKVLRTIDFAPRGKIGPERNFPSSFSPGRICRLRQNLPTSPGKYFHFYSNADDGNPVFPRLFLVHDGTTKSEQL